MRRYQYILPPLDSLQESRREAVVLRLFFFFWSGFLTWSSNQIMVSNEKLTGPDRYPSFENNAVTDRSFHYGI